MFDIGEKIIYGENGVCTVEKIAPLEMSGASREKLYYYLTPLVGSGTYFAPVDSGAYMRPVMSREEAEALIDAMPGIEPAICNDNRFNHVDAYYKELFRQHSCEALVAIVKGLRQPGGGHHEAGAGHAAWGALCGPGPGAWGGGKLHHQPHRRAAPGPVRQRLRQKTGTFSKVPVFLWFLRLPIGAFAYTPPSCAASGCA